MKVLMKLFESELDKFLNIESSIDCRHPPQKLLRELRSNNGSKLLKAMQAQTSNPFKIMRMLSVANLLLIYSINWFDLIEKSLKHRLSRDEWINTKFLQPYYRFIIKCCTSKDSYNDSKTLAYNKSDTFQMLFYSINMLKQLFKAIQKMPLIGRYYKTKNHEVVSSAIDIIALQAHRLYCSFKHALGEILANHRYHITNKQNQRIIKGILVDELSYINQEMKKLFLDKYFKPLSKGINLKLFRPEEQNPECEKTYKTIVSNHQETERRKRKSELELKLFPGTGLVNWNFIEDTMEKGRKLNVSAPVKTCMGIYDLDDSDKGEQVEQVPMPRASRKKEGQSQKETNTGTLQISGFQL